jgi:ADP-ribose pyrophosphatase YjhB (NUDIX family)
MHKKKIANLILELQALSQSGLSFASTPYDEDRYQRLLEISAELISLNTTYSFEDIKEYLLFEKGYAAPKVEVRAMILQGEQVLLVKESADGKWSLPGGFADVSLSASESIIKEVREETGYVFKPGRLLAVLDRNKHLSHIHWPHLYKMFFLGDILGGIATPSHETTEIAYFNINRLPILSEFRVTEKQILSLYQHAKTSNETIFD